MLIEESQRAIVEKGVKDGQVVILDSGTTTTAIARALRHHRNLTIITTALNIAAELYAALSTRRRERSQIILADR